MPRFLESLKHIDVEHIAVQFTPYTEGLKTIFTGVPYPGHIQKYAYVPRDLDPERYVIFTDTDDVIFQKELPEFGEFDLYLAPENVIHRGSWWEPYIHEHEKEFGHLLDKPIYCSGTWAMKVKTLYELLAHQQKIGIFGNLCQCYFNSFIYSRPDLTRYEDLGLFCSLHANMHRDDVVKGEDGIWRHNGEVITCVHANGSLKDYL